jgi:DNA-binding beta-propeller fold protein YncE
MRLTLTSTFLLATLASAAHAQQAAAPPSVPELACGVHGDVEVFCGTRQPEDLEVTPDGKFLLATQYLNEGRNGATGGGMALFDPVKKTFTKMTMTAAPDKSWGDPACPGPIGDALVSHGSSLAKRANGVWSLYLVNHATRQSIEMFELKQASGSWALIWHGCVVGSHEYNDVAILPDGGFVASYPTGLGNTGAAFGPNASGYVTRWTPGKGESEVEGTRMRYPNGVVASADGKTIYVNEFAAKVVHKLDLQSGKDIATVPVDFLPDNLTWTKAGRLLVAGVKGARGDCPEKSGRPCIQGFGVAEIDPATMKARVVFDSAEHDPLITGVSVALEYGDSIYLGGFRADRIVRVPNKR